MNMWFHIDSFIHYVEDKGVNLPTRFRRWVCDKYDRSLGMP